MSQIPPRTAGSVSILIPTFNMAKYLEPLWTSIVDTGLADFVDKILFVNDGSTDESTEVLGRLRDRHAFGTKLHVLHLEPNCGRFLARYAGARHLKSDWVLFLDTRLTLHEKFGQALHSALQRGRNTVGWVDIDVTRNLFCLYWQRSHERIFQHHYRSSRGPSADDPKLVELTLENYDNFLKGTGVFLCRRESFLKACAKIEGLDTKSDDTLLMKLILELEPMLIDPELRINWEPRSDMVTFLLRLFERGPSFTEYHVFKRQGLFFYVVLAGLIFLGAWIAVVLVDPLLGAWLAMFSLVLVGLSALAFSHSFSEWLRIWPLHILVVLFFGTGILWGLAFNLTKPLRRQISELKT